LTGSEPASKIRITMGQNSEPAGTLMRVSAVVLAILVLTPLFAGCESQPKAKTKPQAKATKAVSHCLKAAEPADETLLVIQWKWNGSHAGSHDISYFTFRYTPTRDEPCSYDSIRALICERYVTSHTTLTTNCQFAGKQEAITKIVVNADKIVHLDAGIAAPIGSATSQCTCFKP
jgi:hypothetical protein